MHRAKGGSLRAGLADARHKRGRRKAKVTKNVSVKFFHEVHVFLVENDHRSAYVYDHKHKPERHSERTSSLQPLCTMRRLSGLMILLSIFLQRPRTSQLSVRDGGLALVGGAFQKTLKISSSLAILSLFFGSSLACEHHNQVQQRNLELQARMPSCGTISPTEEERAAMRATTAAWTDRRGPSVRQSTLNYTVPVYVHVMAANLTTGVVNSTQIDTMIAFANSAFQKSGVPFYLNLTGTDVTYNETYFNCQTATERNYKAALKKGGSDTVNLYLCDLCPGSPCQMGFASYPTKNSILDGVVLMRPGSGILVASDDSVHTTLVHELGHWFGLLHTFDGYNSNTAPTGGCLPAPDGGDDIADTPAHAGSTLFTTDASQGIWDCFRPVSTYGVLDTCADDLVGVDPGPDPIDNYMNYVPASCLIEYGEL
jgi:hypothetical protein